MLLLLFYALSTDKPVQYRKGCGNMNMKDEWEGTWNRQSWNIWKQCIGQSVE